MTQGAHVYSAYEQLPPRVRAAMWGSVNDWNAFDVGKYLARHNVEQTIQWLRNRDVLIMRKTAFYAECSADELTFSTYTACKVKPLR